METCWKCKKAKTVRDLAMCSGCSLPSMKKDGKLCCEDCARKIEREMSKRKTDGLN